MKKTLFIFLAAIPGFIISQASPSWTISQNATFTVGYAGIKLLDAVSPNDVWAIGYNGQAVNQNVNWWSKTNNGGTNWVSGNVFPDTNTYVLDNLEGINGTTAWVSAYKKSTQSQGVIYKTSNGGTTWNDMTPAGMFTNTASFVDAISFLTPSIGIVVGDPVGGEFEIWRTTDGGSTWSLIPGVNIPDPTSGEYGFSTVYCKFGTSYIWFGTSSGRVYRSTDAGLTWNVSTLPSSPLSTASLADIAFTSTQNGVAYILNNTSFEMYNTFDGGVTWSALSPIPGAVGRSDINYIPGTNYLVSCGAGASNFKLSYSPDNGVNWVDWGTVSSPYTRIDFYDGNSGWAGTLSDYSDPTHDGISKYNGSVITSINDFSLEKNSISVYPNPASDKFKVDYSGSEKIKVSVLNTIGQTVIQYPEEITEFDLSGLAKGIYFVKIQSNNKIETRKIIKQ